MLSSRNVNDTDSESYERPHDDMMSWAFDSGEESCEIFEENWMITLQSYGVESE